MPIYEFNGVESKVEGTIKLPMTIGQGSKTTTQMLNFLVIKATSTYNAILGRTGLHAFKAVASTYHLKIKFPTRNRVGEERGDQKMARSCYVAALRLDGVGGQVLPIEDMVKVSDIQHDCESDQKLGIFKEIASVAQYGILSEFSWKTGQSLLNSDSQSLLSSRCHSMKILEAIFFEDGKKQRDIEMAKETEQKTKAILD
ncbi:hypothetical protein POM88_035992 [Heracleum sosnowskyi]|uniref:Uncharacterized protein n=1 Tax=Heracleum sosnowskyi TaxID=360622 RepID=A0AAD8MC11_9APIA|nr:hypothetical protein POM88_035992 [Heracleum sosnowskyi]